MRDRFRRSSPGLSLEFPGSRDVPQARLAEQVFKPEQPISPFPMCWCLSRRPPAGLRNHSGAKLQVRQTHGPVDFLHQSRLCSSERKSYPAANPWQVSKQKPSRFSFPPIRGSPYSSRRLPRSALLLRCSPAEGYEKGRYNFFQTFMTCLRPLSGRSARASQVVTTYRAPKSSARFRSSDSASTTFGKAPRLLRPGSEGTAYEPHRSMALSGSFL